MMRTGETSIEQPSIESLLNNLIWGIDEVCRFTKYARGTIYNLVSKGDIPVCKRGHRRKLVFIPRDVISWFKGE
jgi:predicted DNA-binding transcriptional regulator AlpA